MTDPTIPPAELPEPSPPCPQCDGDGAIDVDGVLELCPRCSTPSAQADQLARAADGREG